MYKTLQLTTPATKPKALIGFKNKNFGLFWNLMILNNLFWNLMY